MDWALAIDLNRKALLRVLAMLFAVAGIAPGGSVATLPRHLRCTVLRLLRPAESAARRLIVIAAQQMGRRGPSEGLRRARNGSGGSTTGPRAPGFALFDPRRRAGLPPAPHPVGPGPRICVPGLCDPVFVQRVPPLSDDPVDAARLCRRLQALHRALDDLPRQARRMVRRMAAEPVRRAMRPGRPPGHRARPEHAVDTLLAECHELALYALNTRGSA